MNYAKTEFRSISGVIFTPASGGFVPDSHRGSAPGPDLPSLFKLHDIWLVDSQENYFNTVATKCQILRLKCTTFDFGWVSAPDPAGELTALPRPPSWIYEANF